MLKERIKAIVIFRNEKDFKDSEKFVFLKDERFIFHHKWKNTLKENELKNFDLIIAVGGDGTVLSASHYAKKQKILAVNSSPKTSEGALTTISLDKIDKKLDEIYNGTFKYEKLERIEVKINGVRQNPLALNEVFIASDKAYLISRYKIKFTGKSRKTEEEQYSSGIIFSTGTGSTAWFKSAGGETFSPHAKHIKMIVREPYIRNLHKFYLLKHNIEEGESIEIIPETDFVLAIDSIREFPLTPGDKVTISVSESPLLRII